MRVKAPMKLSTKMAVLEFSSSNGYSSFTLDYECQRISIIDTSTVNLINYFNSTGDDNQINFSYLVELPLDGILMDWGPLSHPDKPLLYKACKERGYEGWQLDFYYDVYYCRTTFQG